MHGKSDALIIINAYSAGELSLYIDEALQGS